MATARAEHAELQGRLKLFEMIAASAGASLAEPAWWGVSVPAAPMPSGLVAAAGALHQQDVPVRLDVGGTDVIAVVSGPGDPREWWSAIWQVARRSGDAS